MKNKKGKNKQINNRELDKIAGGAGATSVKRIAPMKPIILTRLDTNLEPLQINRKRSGAISAGSLEEAETPKIVRIGRVTR